MRHRTDGPHAEVRKALRKLLGDAHVRDVSQSEIGCDLIAPERHEHFPIFIEIKPKGPPSARKLRPNEEALQAAFPDHYVVVSTPAEALRALGYSVSMEGESF